MSLTFIPGRHIPHVMKKIIETERTSTKGIGSRAVETVITWILMFSSMGFTPMATYSVREGNLTFVLIYIVAVAVVMVVFVFSTKLANKEFLSNKIVFDGIVYDYRRNMTTDVVIYALPPIEKVSLVEVDEKLRVRDEKKVVRKRLQNAVKPGGTDAGAVDAVNPTPAMAFEYEGEADGEIAVDKLIEAVLERVTKEKPTRDLFVLEFPCEEFDFGDYDDEGKPVHSGITRFFLVTKAEPISRAEYVFSRFGWSDVCQVAHVHMNLLEWVRLPELEGEEVKYGEEVVPIFYMHSNDATLRDADKRVSLSLKDVQLSTLNASYAFISGLSAMFKDLRDDKRLFERRVAALNEKAWCKAAYYIRGFLGTKKIPSFEDTPEKKRAETVKSGVRWGAILAVAVIVGVLFSPVIRPFLSAIFGG